MAVQQIIDNALAVANLKAAQAEAYSGQAYLSATGSTFIKAGKIDKESPREPSVYIPSRASGLDTAVFNSMYDMIINDLSDKYADWLTRYFPFNAQLMQVAEDWLLKAIRDGGTGINATVEARIWQRDRDRISAEAASTIDEATALWASKGYPMPPGAAQASIMDIQRKRNADVAAVSRDAAIKAFETEVENIKFAITTAIDYRTKVLNAAGDYIRALAVAPNIASSLATQSADAQARLISAASGYYNARINAAELAQKRNIFNADMDMKAILETQDNAIKLVGLRVQAATAAAESLGKQAAAALNAINATSELIESAG